MNIRQRIKFKEARHVTFTAGALICALFASAASQSADDWVPIKDPAELRALYSNKTFNGEAIASNYSFVGHYRADGRGIVIHDGKTNPRTWTVNKSGQVCVTGATERDCWVYWRKRDNQNEIKGMRIRDGWGFTAKVADGVPKF